jgi:nitrous oxidase accessory protein NosD
VSRRTPRLDALFALLLVVMIAHEAEHVAQVTQKDILHSTCPMECRGVLGSTFDLEWVHAAYNDSILVLLVLLYVGYRMWRRDWRRRTWPWLALTLGIFIVQGWHVVEHTVKLDQWLENGHRSPTPGILGQHVRLIELHFTINTIVLLLVVAGYLGFGLHRRLRLDRPTLAIVGTGMVALLAVGGTAWAGRPPTVRLAAGVHQGPLVLDHAQRLQGEPGAVVRGGIVVTAGGVVVDTVTVEGGDFGINVDGAKDVLLDRVRVVGAKLDAIHVRRSSVFVHDCEIDSRGEEWAQGVDISFSADLPPSRVEGSTVVGGLEGIVSHSAHVSVRLNRVSNTSLDAISVTEMSMGTIERNRVEHALGIGIFCGDHSMCRIEHNTVRETRPDPDAYDATRSGYGIVVHWNSEAEVGNNRLGQNPHGLGAFTGARIKRHFSS